MKPNIHNLLPKRIKDAYQKRKQTLNTHKIIKKKSKRPNLSHGINHNVHVVKRLLAWTKMSLYFKVDHI